MNNKHQVNQVPYAMWVYKVFTLTNPEDLDEYGPFDHIEVDAEDAYEHKALMFLNTVISNEDSREMFWKSSSTLVLEDAEHILREWEEDDLTHLEAYAILSEVLFEYLDGC
tara:strand:- start:1104 stop:1436 length:333 start_codon:yes stop_codon:yes gene_type:complete